MGIADIGKELIGWAAAALLIATIGRQVFTQWRAGTTAGVSRWLFVGQVSASVLFVIYSWLEGDWVFIATNSVMLATAILGQCIYLQNRRKNRRNRASNTTGDRAKKPYSAQG